MKQERKMFGLLSCRNGRDVIPRIFFLLTFCCGAFILSILPSRATYKPGEKESTITAKHRKNMAKHIAFFYNPETDPRNMKRLHSLERVLSNVETYTELYDVDVMVHTNRLNGNSTFDLQGVLGYKCNLPSNNQWKCPNVTVMTHTMDRNPHYLTWMHREAMHKQYSERKDYYDVFLYVEDDQMFTLENLKYWHEYAPKARQWGCRLGFLRIHPDIEITGGMSYFSPRRKWANISKNVQNVYIDSNASSTTKDKTSEWAVLEVEATYWAGWIMDRYDFGFFLSSSDYLPTNINRWKMREIAAWGAVWGARMNNGTIVVPLLARGGEKKLHLHPGAKTYHLSDKFVNDSCRIKWDHLSCNHGEFYDNFTI